MVRDSGLRAAKKEQTRVTIARSALRLFLDRGFEAVSIAEIAEAAGVSKMTVFNYFPAKEDMFFWFIRGVMPDLGGVVRQRPAGQVPVEALHRFFRSELQRRAEWTGLHDGSAQFTRLILTSPTLINGFDRIWREREQELLAAMGQAAGLSDIAYQQYEPLVEVLLAIGRLPDGTTVPHPPNAPPASHPPDVTTRPADVGAGVFEAEKGTTSEVGTADRKAPGGSGSVTTPGGAGGRTTAAVVTSAGRANGASGLAPAVPTTEVVILRVVVGQILAAIQHLVIVNQIRQGLGKTADDSAGAALAECDAAFDLLGRGIAAYGT